MNINKYVIPQMLGGRRQKGEVCVIEFADYVKEVDIANKEGWDSAIDAAAELMETGAGVDADYLREQLKSA